MGNKNGIKVINKNSKLKSFFKSSNIQILKAKIFKRISNQKSISYQANVSFLYPLNALETEPSCSINQNKLKQKTEDNY